MGKSLSAALLAACSVAACSTTRSEERTFNTARDLFSVQRDDILTRREAAFTDQRYTLQGTGEQQRTGGHNAGHMNSIRSVLDIYRTRAQIALEYERSVLTSAQLNGASAAPNQQNYLASLREYRNAGWAASDAICQYTLDLLGESQSEFQNVDRNVTIGSGFVATLLGIGGASADALAYFAASDALYDSWSQGFEEYAFISPSARELSRLVRSAQMAYRQAQGADSDPQTWNDATVQIQTYNRFCLATGMRNLVNEAVRGADVDWNDRNGLYVIGSNAVDDAMFSASIGILVSRLRERDRLESRRTELNAERSANNVTIARYDAELLQIGDAAAVEQQNQRNILNAQKGQLQARNSVITDELREIEATLPRLQTEITALATNLPTRRPGEKDEGDAPVETPQQGQQQQPN